MLILFFGTGSKVWIQIRLQILSKIVSEYDQKIPQSQTEDKPTGPRGEPHNHHETPGRQTKQSNHFPIKMIAKLEWT